MKVEGITNAQRDEKGKMVTGYTVVATGATFNTTFSSVSRSGNVVIISFGGCIFDNTAAQVRNYITGLPNSITKALGLIYNDALVVIGYVMMDGTTLKYATSQAQPGMNALGQLVYITDDP